MTITLQRFWVLSLAFLVALVYIPEVDAKRLGGGRSYGSAPSHAPQRSNQATPDSTRAAPNATPARPMNAPSGASRWLGPLAGLAAGGLLASMFMGDGFQGMQGFDWLIIGVLAFLAYRFFMRRRAKNTLAVAGMPNTLSPNSGSSLSSMLRNQLQGGASANQRDTKTWTNGSSTHAAPNGFDAGSTSGSTYNQSSANSFNAPDWFNAARFIEQGRQQFMALQQNWDANEMDTLAEYFSPEMMDFLKRERADQAANFQSTYIDGLQVNLDGVEQENDKTIATLNFSGISKNSRFDQGEHFNESWRLERNSGDNQPWIVTGIRQNMI